MGRKRPPGGGFEGIDRFRLQVRIAQAVGVIPRLGRPKGPAVEDLGRELAPVEDKTQSGSRDRTIVAAFIKPGAQKKIPSAQKRGLGLNICGEQPVGPHVRFSRNRGFDPRGLAPGDGNRLGQPLLLGDEAERKPPARSGSPEQLRFAAAEAVGPVIPVLTPGRFGRRGFNDRDRVIQNRGVPIVGRRPKRPVLPVLDRVSGPGIDESDMPVDPMVADGYRPFPDASQLNGCVRRILVLEQQPGAESLVIDPGVGRNVVFESVQILGPISIPGPAFQVGLVAGFEGGRDFKSEVRLFVVGSVAGGGQNGPEIPEPGRNPAAGPLPRAPGDDVDDARNGVGPVQGRGRAINDFDPFDVLQVVVPPSVITARIQFIDQDAVDEEEDLVILARNAPDERIRVEAGNIAELNSGQTGQGVFEGEKGVVTDVFGGDDPDCGRRPIDRFRDFQGGNDLDVEEVGQIEAEQLLEGFFLGREKRRDEEKASC